MRAGCSHFPEHSGLCQAWQERLHSLDKSVCNLLLFPLILSRAKSLPMAHNIDCLMFVPACAELSGVQSLSPTGVGLQATRKAPQSMLK